MTAQRRISAIQTGRRLTGLNQEEMLKTVGGRGHQHVLYWHIVRLFIQINIETEAGEIINANQTDSLLDPVSILRNVRTMGLLNNCFI